MSFNVRQTCELYYIYDFNLNNDEQNEIKIKPRDHSAESNVIDFTNMPKTTVGKRRRVSMNNQVALTL